MSAVDAAQEILRREQAQPGSVPPALLAKAQALAGGGPEFTGTGTRTTDPEAGGGGLLRLGGHLIQAASRAGDALDVGASEFANALTLGGAGALDPMFSDPRYAAAKQEHPVAALGGQVAGLASGMNPANMAAGAIAAPLRGAIGGSMIGRAVAGGVEGAAAGGLGAGAITAAGGGSGDQIFNSAATGAGVGGALGAAGSLLQEPGKWLRGLLSSKGAPPVQAPPQGPLPNIPDLQATGPLPGPQGAPPGLQGPLAQVPPPPQWAHTPDLQAPPPVAGPPRPPPGLQQVPPLPPRFPPHVPDLQGAPPPGPPPPPMGLQQAPPLTPPGFPDLEVPPKPEPVPSAAPHEPLPPEPEMSTVHRPRPGDTGMGAEEARRALDSEALHMANRTAAVNKLVNIIPPGADSQWLGRMTADERARLADFVGVTHVSDETWAAVGDALDAQIGPALAKAAPRPVMAARAGQRGMVDTDMLLAGIRALRGQRSGGPSLGLDPSIEFLLQSRPVINAAGMAIGTKLPAATNRQPGQPIDLLNLYGM